MKAKVALIEKRRARRRLPQHGLRAEQGAHRGRARLLAEARDSTRFGIARMDAQFDFAEVMARVQRVIAKIEPHDSVERYTGLGVEVIRGDGAARLAVGGRGERPRGSRRGASWSRPGPAARAEDPRARRACRSSRARRSGTCARCRAASSCSAADRSAASSRRRSRASGARVTRGRDGAAPPAARGRRRRRRARPSASRRKASRSRPGIARCGERAGDERDASATPPRAGASSARTTGARGRARVRHAARRASAGKARVTGFGLEELGVRLRDNGTDRRRPAAAHQLPEHPRLRRRHRAVPVHPRRLAPGLVRGGATGSWHRSGPTAPTIA